ncbi:MAG: hypothetical protein ABI216_11160 [Devosia sp.]
MISIARCHESDVADLMTFIEEHWRHNHILATNRAVLDWQHKCADGTYNFLLARRESGLAGVLGYIPTSRYDESLSANETIWLALWKVRTDLGRTGLGLALLRELGRLHPTAQIGVNGINHEHPNMYGSLGFHSGELKQYYVVNPRARRVLVVGQTGHGSVLPYPKAGQAVFSAYERATPISLEVAPELIPRKSPRYFAQRFLEHPLYQYRVHAISLEGQSRALIATRIDEYKGARALRIVDFLGDASVLQECGTAIDSLLTESAAEYADLWQHGLPDACLRKAGLVASVEGGPIVPSYYEPFVPDRARILFSVRVREGQEMRIFKADGDQDRPNHVENQT